MKEKSPVNILDVIKRINSVCTTCRGTGLKRENNTLANPVPCTCCKGKGYHTYSELLKDVKCI